MDTNGNYLGVLLPWCEYGLIEHGAPGGGRPLGSVGKRGGIALVWEAYHTIF